MTITTWYTLQPYWVFSLKGNRCKNIFFRLKWRRDQKGKNLNYKLKEFHATNVSEIKSQNCFTQSIIIFFSGQFQTCELNLGIKHLQIIFCLKITIQTMTTNIEHNLWKWKLNINYISFLFLPFFHFKRKIFVYNEWVSLLENTQYSRNAHQVVTVIII